MGQAALVVLVIASALAFSGPVFGSSPAAAERTAPARPATRAVPTVRPVTTKAAKAAKAAKRTAPPPHAAGSIDAVVGSSSSVRVRGWALNPGSAAGLGVFVSVDRTWYLAAANGSRPDLARLFPASGGSHGYDTNLPAGPGTHFVCVVAGGGGTTPTILGCRLVTVTANLPYGAMETATISGAQQVRVTGWTIDPDTSAPVTAVVQVDGVTVASGSANGARPDLAPLGAGTAHGYDLTAPVPLGIHLVCVLGNDVGGLGAASLGCRAVDMPQTNPTGVLDAVGVSGSSVVATGWANDPDGNGPSTVTVGVTNPGFDDPTSVTVTADVVRPDLPAAGIPAARGFSAQVPGVPAGTHTVCVAVRNQNFGSDQLIGCKALTFTDHRPTGSVDSITPVTGGFSTYGWVADPDSSAPVSVRVVVDGTSHTITANQSRPDVGAAYPAFGPNRGFSTQVTGLAAGIHTVCVVGTDLPGGPGLTGDRAFPCGSVVVGAGLAAATNGVAGSPTPVGPAGSNPLSGIDRDAGVSVRLRDGSTLWLFGDSMISNPDGSLRSFVHDTAAWAPAGQPTVTHDGSSGGQPVTFAAPGAGFPPCTDASASPAMWPLSAVVVPNGSIDRVLVYLANVCVSPNKTLEPHGTALVEWDYDPASPPDGQAIQGQTLAQVLFPDIDAGEAATIGPDGYVYVYGCDGPANGGWPTQYGPCTVARVSTAQIGQASSYAYWNGSTWVASPSAAAAMTLPNGPDGVTNIPPGGVSVTWDAANHVYEMVYSPWPGFTDQLAIRLATSPQGPWTAPLLVALPGCDDAVGGVGYFCYAGGAQPQLSQPGLLGIGYYDQLVAVGPKRGSYLVTTVQLGISTS